jgi:ABC-type multidrug transport system ATPase subunit
VFVIIDARPANALSIPVLRREGAREALSRVGLADRIQHKPNELSGGQRQRVAIARALVGRPELLLADVPTGNLDSNTAREIMSLLIGLHAEGLTLIIVTHDPGIASHCHRVVRLHDGRIAEDFVQQPARSGAGFDHTGSRRAALSHRWHQQHHPDRVCWHGAGLAGPARLQYRDDLDALDSTKLRVAMLMRQLHQIGARQPDDFVEDEPVVARRLARLLRAIDPGIESIAIHGADDYSEVEVANG